MIRILALLAAACVCGANVQYPYQYAGGYQYPYYPSYGTYNYGYPYSYPNYGYSGYYSPGYGAAGAYAGVGTAAAAGVRQQPIVETLVPTAVGQAAVVAAAPVVAQAVVEAEPLVPAGGHYEIYKYGRSEFLEPEPAGLEPMNPEEVARFARPFTVLKKPHYEIYKYGRSAY